MPTPCPRRAHAVPTPCPRRAHAVPTPSTCISTALQLYAKYRELVAKGTLQETITQLHAETVESRIDLPSMTTAPHRPACRV